ncbi:hypothetical protein K438DRAFT_1834028 [Mycena galopus ATCC 62051]|nr:hypothetical protein K438DRAFT_1834028 [Mycena galopus ATCC 62051]
MVKCAEHTKLALNAIWKTEPWYGTEYYVEKFDDAFIQQAPEPVFGLERVVSCFPLLAKQTCLCPSPSAKQLPAAHYPSRDFLQGIRGETSCRAFAAGNLLANSCRTFAAGNLFCVTSSAPPLPRIDVFSAAQDRRGACNATRNGTPRSGARHPLLGHIPAAHLLQAIFSLPPHRRTATLPLPPIDVFSAAGGLAAAHATQRAKAHHAPALDIHSSATFLQHICCRQSSLCHLIDAPQRRRCLPSTSSVQPAVLLRRTPRNARRHTALRRSTSTPGGAFPRGPPNPRPRQPANVCAPLPRASTALPFSDRLNVAAAQTASWSNHFPCTSDFVQEMHCRGSYCAPIANFWHHFYIFLVSSI